MERRLRVEPTRRSVVIGPASSDLCRAVGAMSWAVLVEMAQRSTGDDDMVARVSIRELAPTLGLAKDTPPDPTPTLRPTATRAPPRAPTTDPNDRLAQRGFVGRHPISGQPLKRSGSSQPPMSGHIDATIPLPACVRERNAHRTLPGRSNRSDREGARRPMGIPHRTIHYQTTDDPPSEARPSKSLVRTGQRTALRFGCST